MTKLNDHGVAHQLVLAAAVIALASGGVFTLVLKSSHQQSSSALHANAASKTRLQVTGSSGSASSLATVVPATAPVDVQKPAAQAAVSAPSKTPNKAAPKTTGSPAPATTVQPANNSNPAPTPSPLSVLTNIIADLQNGISAQVTAKSVEVAGPINDAHAQPIVFTLNGTTYFAYTQGHAPNFDTSPSETAGTMAIMTTDSKPALTSAYLDKSNHLTNPAFESVGYSTGGDRSGK